MQARVTTPASIPVSELFRSRREKMTLRTMSHLQPTNPETPVPTPGPQQQCLMAQSANNGVVFHTDSTIPVFLQTA